MRTPTLSPVALRRRTAPRSLLLASFLALLTLTACTSGPREVRIGQEECAHCRMLVSQSRFATQLITDRGRSHVFDSAECMAEFLDEGEAVDPERVRSLWVTDFNRPGVWIPVEAAVFLQSENLRSPMGVGLSSYANRSEAAAQRAEHGGELMEWEEVRALVAEMRVNGGGHGHAH